jgi:hypothetical protein
MKITVWYEGKIQNKLNNFVISRMTLVFPTFKSKNGSGLVLNFKFELFFHLSNSKFDVFDCLFQKYMGTKTCHNWHNIYFMYFELILQNVFLTLTNSLENDFRLFSFFPIYNFSFDCVLKTLQLFDCKQTETKLKSQQLQTVQ